MGKNAKILAVLGVFCVTAVGVAIVSKNAKKRRFINVTRGGSTEKTEKSDNKTEEITKQMWDAACKKTMDILAWAGEHEKEAKGVVVGLEIVAAGIGVGCAIKKYNKQDKILKELSLVKKHVYDMGYSACFKDTRRLLYECATEDIPLKILGDNDIILAQYVIKEVTA